MALSTAELLAALKKLKGDDLKEAKKVLGAKDSSIDVTSKKEVQTEQRRLELLKQQSLALGEINNASKIAFEQEKIFEDIRIAAAMTVEEFNKNRLKILKEQTGLTGEQIENVEKLAKRYKELGEAGAEAFEATKEDFEDIALKIGLNSREANSAIKTFQKFQFHMKEGGKGVRAAFSDVFSYKKMGAAVLAQVVEATIKLATAVEKATAAFAANTGAGRVMTNQIAEVGGNFRNLGLTAEDAGKAAQTLFNNFSGFMQVTQAEQENLMQTVAGLEKIGVSGESAAQTLVLMNKNFGKSTTESIKLTKQLSIMGTKIGISSSKMVQGFNEAAKQLAVYGDDAIKVFSDLAAQAKAANVETSALLGIATQFDTFSGAADAVGKLNSILGTQLSTVEMQQMKENERIETLIRSIQAQGIAFKDLDRFSQKAVAAAAGITDMAEAQRIFGMNVNDYRKGLQEAAAEEEFNKRLKDAMDVFKKLEMIAMNFAINMTPVVSVIADFAQMILDASSATKAFAGVLISIPIVLGLIVGGMMIFSQLLPLFTAFGTIGAPAASTGLSTLSKVAPPASNALGKAAPKLLAFSAAIALLGVGIAAMSYGIGVMISELTELIQLGLQAPKAFMQVASGVSALASALMMAGNPMAVLGLGVLGVALAAVGKTISMIDTDKLVALGNIFGNDKLAAANFDSMNDAFKTMAQNANIKPIIGDLALVAVGKTTQKVTTESTGYTLQQFSAKFDNVFKPEIVVKIGDKELKNIVHETQRGSNA